MSRRKKREEEKRERERWSWIKMFTIYLSIEVDKTWRSATNGKFELVVYRSNSWTCKVVDASTCHPFFQLLPKLPRSPSLLFALCIFSIFEFAFNQIFFFSRMIKKSCNSNILLLSLTRLHRGLWERVCTIRVDFNFIEDLLQVEHNLVI